MSKLAQLLEGPGFVPSAAAPAPAADTSAFDAPAAPEDPTPGDFLDQIAEQIFAYLAENAAGGDPNTEVDAFLAELRERLVNN